MTTELAKLTLSGETFYIGTDQSADGADITIHHTGSVGEPVFLSTHDAELLIAALKHAVFEAKGEPADGR
jgi:hypothetical protein